MRCVIDIECNALENPTKIWVIVCKDIDTGELHIFRRPTDEEDVARSFAALCDRVSVWIGHNVIAYDFPILNKLLQFSLDNIHERCYDTFIISKLANYSRKSHSLESYGLEFNYPKGDFHEWSHYSQEMEDYCVNDAHLGELVFHHLHREFSRYVRNKKAIETETAFALVCSDLRNNGFAFDEHRCRSLLAKVEQELGELDAEIKNSFLPHLKPIREINPKLTKFGTINRTDFRWVPDGNLSQYNGGPFTRCSWEVFNPASHRQVISVLNRAGWKPVSKTKAHIVFTRSREENPHKAEHFLKYGWKVNEENLSTLPVRAPSAAKTLARRILYEARRRTLTEWLSLVSADGRVHGQFQGIGAWTQRMSHQKPNMANIPNSHELDGSVKLLGAEMRSLFIAPKNRLLVGVDAEGIQLRIFAHYINDEEFTKALVEGKKNDKTDCHSLNQRVLGSVCKTRAASKRFVYALLLGAGMGKLAEILECNVSQAKEALDRLLVRYTGFQRLKQDVVPKDAARGYFIGLDGRQVPLPGDSKRDREHLAISGYLQNGESIVMKMATLKWRKMLLCEDIDDWLLVNLVHDEWQTETRNDLFYAVRIAQCQCRALEQVGEELKLKCPLAGSYGDDPDNPNTWTIGRNWKVTH